MFDAEALRTKCDEKGLSLSALAKKTGQDRVLVSSWANGRRVPLLESVVRMADALDCSLDDLVIRGKALTEHKKKLATQSAEQPS